MMRLIRLEKQLRTRRTGQLSDGSDHVVEEVEHWRAFVERHGELVELDFDTEPTDDDLATETLARVAREITPTTNKAALAEVMEDRIEEAFLLDWFNTKVQADGAVGAVAKAAVQAVANGAYARAKQAALAWAQA